MFYSEFFELFFDNLWLFIPCVLICSALCYFSIRKIAISGLLDPIHFYWTFTFGTSYGVVLGLFLLERINLHLFYLIVFSAVLFIFSLKFFTNFNSSLFSGLVKFLKINNNGNIIVIIGLVIMVFIYLILLRNVGANFFNPSQRFDNNAGFGPLVRWIDSFRLFFISYVFLKISTSLKNKSLKMIFLFLFMLFSSFMNGAKFSLLESMLTCIVAYSLFFKIRIKINFKYFLKVLGVASFLIIFVLYSLHFQSVSNGGDNGSQYLGENIPKPVENLVKRIVSNGDQYYLGLPDNVVDHIGNDSFSYMLVTSLIGANRAKIIFNKSEKAVNVGKRIVLFHDSLAQSSPVSHFDLFFYKYFTGFFFWIGIIIISYFIASVFNLNKVINLQGDFYTSSIVTTLWMKVLICLLEPAMGFAYIIDFIMVLLSLKFIAFLLPKKGI